MKVTLKRLVNRRTAGYLLAAVLMLVLFLFLRFPGGAVTDYLKAAVAAWSPGARLDLKPVRPVLPPGLRADQITLHAAGRSEGLLRIDRLTIRPGWLSLLRGRLTLLTTAEGYGGQGQGRIAFQRPLAFAGPIVAEGSFQGIRADKSAWLQEVLSRPVTGQLQGSFNYRGTTGSLRSGAGQLDFTVVNGIYPLREPLFGLDRVEFSRIEGRVGYRHGSLQLIQLTLTGDKLRLSFRGNVLLAEPWPDSRLDLVGTVELSGQGNKRLRVAIEGTVGSPRARFL